MAKAMKNGNKKLIDALGPVENLESYVKADWWRHLFNANYLRTDGDVVEDADITRKEADLFLKAMGASPVWKILDLCCGQGRHSLEIAQRGYANVVGFDRSHYLIIRARKLNKERGLFVTFKEGDARKLPFANDNFDAVMIAGNSFGYFESDADDLRVLMEALRVLKPAGKLLIDITDGDYMRENFQPRSWEWIDRNYFVCRERSLSQNRRRLISREVITHVNKGVVADQFYAERLYSHGDIDALLTRSGFENARNHSTVSSGSKRNQDLGMMARRIVVVASAKKEWSLVRKRAGAKEVVLVLMGDPDKADMVKPNTTFDEDDYHTIDELKKALAKLKKRRFVYLNRHDTLLRDLRKMKDRCGYILNLCDEGFCNDASKELHIAALLEMMEFHYSGGSPQCLSYCYDKSLVRGMAKEMDIPVPNAFMVNPEDIQFIEFQIPFPVIVKPNRGDSSFGITKKSVCYDLQSLKNAIEQARKRFGYNLPILVEEYLTGKDISVGIIGNPSISYTILPIIQEDYSALPDDLPKICGYEAKWDPKSPYWKIQSIPADLPEDVERFLGASCVKLFERLECQDYARFDWRLDGNGTPRLLEVNPNPGWCWDGHLAKMAKLQGMSYSGMLSAILDACESRMTEKNSVKEN